MTIWYDKNSGLVHGHGNVNLIEVDGEIVVDSVDWNKETKAFIPDFNGPIEGDGPWYYWGDGTVRAAPLVP